MESETTKITKLKDSQNWAQWKFHVSVLMRDREVMPVVDGSLPKPALLLAQPTAEEQRALKTWTKSDNAAQKIISTSIVDSQLLHIMNCSCSNDMWGALYNLYEQKSETSIHMLSKNGTRYPKNPKTVWHIT